MMSKKLRYGFKKEKEECGVKAVTVAQTLRRREERMRGVKKRKNRQKRMGIGRSFLYMWVGWVEKKENGVRDHYLCLADNLKKSWAIGLAHKRVPRSSTSRTRKEIESLFFFFLSILSVCACAELQK